ncbi:MAG: hypothetical protein JRH16_22635 [Deltaproteobacteria bacterium]|nr:hypothetical protein [Deltaproteobacteria bacterium]
MTSRHPDDGTASWHSNEEESSPGLPAFILAPRGVIVRRWPWMLCCALSGLMATGVAVGLWTPSFRSSASILISSQQIPEEFVRSTVREDSIANINAMVGRVLSESNLTRLLDEHDLYGDTEGSATFAARLARLRSNVEIGPVTKSRSRSRETALVYGISFQYPEAEVSAAVANELAAFFVEASIARRQSSAQRATEFLKRELARDEAALSTQARKVTEFRQKYRGQLPDELETNLRKLTMRAAEQDTLNMQIAQQQNRLLELASAPQRMITSENQELLSALRRQLANELAAHTDEHPNVVALRRRIANQQQAVTDERSEATGEDSELGALRRAEQAELRLLRNRLESVGGELAMLDSRVERTPRVTEGLTALEHDEFVLREDYLDTLRKVKEAELAENLESAQQGGQVTILDRARPPGSPVQPMWFTLVGGLVGTLGLALGVAILLELVDPVIVSADQLARITNRSALGSIPEIA